VLVAVWAPQLYWHIYVAAFCEGMSVVIFYSYVPILNLNSVNQLIFVMVKYGVLFEVRTEFLNNI
jgi:hypothetical protein